MPKTVSALRFRLPARTHVAHGVCPRKLRRFEGESA